MAILNRGMAGAPQGLQMAYMRDPRLRLAQQLQMSGSDTSPVGHWTQGLARLAQALAGNRMEDRADSEYRGQAEAYQNDMRGLMAPVMEQGTAGPGPRQGPGGATMRPATFAELSERAGKFSSPYAMEAAQPMLQQAMQAQAAEQAKLRDPMYGRANVRGVGLVDMRGGSPNVLIPEQKAPDELERLFTAAGIGPNDPRRAQYAQSMLENKGRGSQTNVSVATGNTGPQIGSIPQDHQLVKDENGNYRMEVIPGSKTARELADKEKADGNKTTQQGVSSNIVTTDINRIFNKMDKSIFPTTGLVGNALSTIGGTGANDVRGLLQGIRSEIAFGRLQRMREASPTGGALGAVTAPELELLQNSFGSLEQSQSEEQFRENLKRVEQLYNEIIHTDKHRGGSVQMPQAAPRANPRSGTGAQRAAPNAGGIKFLGFE
jgi:hypothetical protein